MLPVRSNSWGLPDKPFVRLPMPQTENQLSKPAYALDESQTVTEVINQPIPQIAGNSITSIGVATLNGPEDVQDICIENDFRPQAKTTPASAMQDGNQARQSEEIYGE